MSEILKQTPTLPQTVSSSARKAFTLTALQVVVILCATIGVVGISACTKRQEKRSTWSREMSKLGAIRNAMVNYQTQSSDQNLPTLEELSKYAGDTFMARFMTFEDPKTGNLRQWLYLPEGQQRHADPFIILTAPIVTRADLKSGALEWRLVLISDMTVIYLKESEYQSPLLSKTAI
jgi:hypothetical protein